MSSQPHLTRTFNFLQGEKYSPRKEKVEMKMKISVYLEMIWKFGVHSHAKSESRKYEPHGTEGKLE